MNIMQYCSVCKAEYEMTVVPTSDGDDDGVVWLQCPSCKGFLPKVSSSAVFNKVNREADESKATDDGAVDSPTSSNEIADQPAEVADDEPDVATLAKATHSPNESNDEPEPDDPLSDMDISQAVAYRPWESYDEGDVIHHLAWDDYGVVVAKETLPGNRMVVQVKFAEAGVVRLIEQEGDGS